MKRRATLGLADHFPWVPRSRFRLIGEHGTGSIPCASRIEPCEAWLARERGNCPMTTVISRSRHLFVATLALLSMLVAGSPTEAQVNDPIAFCRASGLNVIIGTPNDDVLT